MPRSHLPFQPAWRCTKVLHTYRHPINFISCYFLFKIGADPRVIGSKLSVDECVESMLDRFIDEFESHEKACKRAPKSVYRINFDDLAGDATPLLSSLFDWLGLPLSDADCKRIDTYIRSYYPNLAVGAGEAWMRNGKGCPTPETNVQQGVYLETGRYSYQRFWPMKSFDLVNSVASELGFGKLKYE